ncbi:MAG: hypothetical protein IE890_01985 [Arcobacter sp.]|nr:hypothetical protein [Arcobacter sp.]
MAEDTKAIDSEGSIIVENGSLKKDDSGQINIPLQEDDRSDIKEIQEEFVKKPKKSPLQKILIGVVFLLLLFIIVGAILYFLGFFKPEEKEVIQEIPQEKIVQETPKEEYKFDIKDINSKKLNEELSFLTNKNLNQEKNEEAERLANEKRILEEEKRKEEEALKAHEDTLEKERIALEEKKSALEREKAELEALREEALKIKEELLNKQTQNENNVEPEQVSNDNVEVKQNDTDEMISNSKKNVNLSEDGFLKFINVAKIKGPLYKKYLDKVTAINPNILLCRDDKNRIEIYYGPFKDENERRELLDKLLSNKFDQAYELEFTKDEFNRRCNY